MQMEKQWVSRRTSSRSRVFNMFYVTVVLVVIGQLVSADLNQQLALSAASSDFSQKLYQKISVREFNSVYSPYSIHSALTMASLGARGNTATELGRTLSITSLGDSVHTIYKELIQQINGIRDVQTYTANAIFLNPKFQTAPSFIQETLNYYSARTDSINFSAAGGPEKPINDYIASKTNNMVVNTLAQGTVTPATAMLLINTIFFNGTWETSFKDALTKKKDFRQSISTVKIVDMMLDNDRTLNIKRDNTIGVDVAEFPFKGGRFSFYIALPQTAEAITELEMLLPLPGKTSQLFVGLTPVRAKVEIPKFKIETSLKLKKTLVELGISDAFNPARADFTGITLSGQLSFDEVIHKAVIDVRETGTVAAAATVISSLKSLPLPPAASFIANHPFVYFLRDKVTGQILFQGKFSG
ncbi:leukocyte elastase inhibitor-like isoform X1 [Biomphalaria glabrata]